MAEEKTTAHFRGQIELPRTAPPRARQMGQAGQEKDAVVNLEVFGMEVKCDKNGECQERHVRGEIPITVPYDLIHPAHTPEHRETPPAHTPERRETHRPRTPEPREIYPVHTLEHPENTSKGGRRRAAAEFIRRHGYI